MQKILENGPNLFAIYPTISVIKVTPKSAYYWDTDGSRMINFLKMVASVATGSNMVTGNQGALKI